MQVMQRVRAMAVALMLALGGGMLTAGPVMAQVELNLRDADIRSFAEIVSEATGRSYVLDPNVRGTVTVLAPQPMSAEALYEVFLNVLELNRLTIVEGVDADRIVPMNTARELSPGSADGGFETRVISVEHVPLAEIVEVVRPLLPAEAVLTPVPGAKLLILSDRGASYRRIEALIRRLDTPRDDPIEIIRLRNANASDVLQVIQSMEIVPAGSNVSVDRRSNALLVSGSSRLREQVRVLAGRLDGQQNNTVSQVLTLNYADAAALADVVLRSFGNDDSPTGGTIRIVPEPQTNALLITAPADRMSAIISMARHLDQRPQQVLVEAVIFEMSVQGFADLSAQFGAVVDNAVVGGVQFALEGRASLSSLVATAADGGTVDPGSGGVLGGRNGGEDGFVGLLTAIATQTSTRLLSTPSLLTLNNQEAEIVVAQNVPFVTGSFTTVGETNNPENPFQTIERQDVGLTLTVTPQINADNTVRLEIAQEVSNLTNATADAGGEITARRALSTTVLVQGGNVVMLGGLVEDGSGSVTQEVPGLAALPLVGGLFRGKNASRDQRVLLVMLRPQIINSETEARRLTRQAARDARQASLALQPTSRQNYPPTPDMSLPFDGANLDQPFDAGFIDDVAKSRNFPPLPSRIQFTGN